MPLTKLISTATFAFVLSCVLQLATYSAKPTNQCPNRDHADTTMIAKCHEAKRMKKYLHSIFILLLSMNGLAADEPLELPDGFSQEPDCLSGTICLARNIEIRNERHFSAIKTAFDDFGHLNYRVASFYLHSINGVDRAHVRLSKENSGLTKIYQLEMQGTEWVIVQEEMGIE